MSFGNNRREKSSKFNDPIEGYEWFYFKKHNIYLIINIHSYLPVWEAFFAIDALNFLSPNAKADKLCILIITGSFKNTLLRII